MNRKFKITAGTFIAGAPPRRSDVGARLPDRHEEN
jgi:hypothetical protein